MWVSDRDNHRVRKLTAGPALATTQPSAWSQTVDISSTSISPVAGSDTVATTDGTGSAAAFQAPVGMHVIAGQGYVFDNFRLRRIDLTSKTVTTIAGSGTNTSGCVDSTDPARTTLTGSADITDDGTYLYWIDLCNGRVNTSRIRRMDLDTGAISSC